MNFFASEGPKPSLITGELELDAVLPLAPGLTLQVGVGFEEVNEEEGEFFEENEYFQQMGLFMEEVFLAYKTGNARFFAGKFNPIFGVGRELAPGPFGHQLPEDYYEQLERVGIGAGYSFGSDDAGEHTLTLQSYFTDTSFLSGSLVASRERLSRSDGGLANTGDFSSYAVSLEGSLPVPGLELEYSTSYMKNAVDEGGDDDETGIALALFGSVDLAGAMQFSPFIEYVSLSIAEGEAQDRDIITLGGTVFYENWKTAASYSRVSSTPVDQDIEDIDTHQLQLSLGYVFENDLQIDIGYIYSKLKINEETAHDHILGIMFRHEFEVGF
ncbi:hypothetical protein [Emcibacter sp.]|uniref:hypothetical protein n=1 Tax=Emcibacter sp. TaxID=1979954 RepID=UPI002AA82601|nr:hypothetical protein [Emcibacter sp.]